MSFRAPVRDLAFALSAVGHDALIARAYPDLDADTVAAVLEAAGSFTADVDALDIHMVISSYCVFRIANRYTFRTLFGRDLVAPERREGYRRLLGDLVVGYLTA